MRQRISQQLLPAISRPIAHVKPSPIVPRFPPSRPALPLSRAISGSRVVGRDVGVSQRYGAPNTVLGELSMSQEQKRSFHHTPTCLKDHHFDTLRFVQRLREEGFSEEQSQALLRVISDVIEESIQNLTRTMVPREDQEKITYTRCAPPSSVSNGAQLTGYSLIEKVDFAKLRSELTALHGSELNPIRSDQERLSSEISRLSARLREEVQRAQSSVKLDLNLEKGRIREESSVHELKIKETDTRIEKEVGDLRGMLESVKFSTLQWLIGVCTGTAALLLGVWRLLM